MLLFWIIFGFVCYASSSTVEDVEMPDCGLTHALSPQDGRVFGGHLVTGFDVPWIVFLRIYIDYNGGARLIACSGSIINQNWVVTAAHCVINPYTHQAIPPNRITMFVGPQFTGQENVGFQQSPRISEVIPHPYSYNQMDYYDIALIRTSDAIQMHSIDGRGYLVNAICLPRSPTSHSIVYSAAGYGMVGQQRSDGKPRQVDGVRLKLDLNDNEDLIELIEHLNEMSGQNIDADYNVDYLYFSYGDDGRFRDEVRPEAVCPGDSGGPLFFRRPDNRFQLVGVNHAIIKFNSSQLARRYPSWVTNQMEQEYPCGIYKIYTDVYSYLQWLVDTVAGEAANEVPVLPELRVGPGTGAGRESVARNRKDDKSKIVTLAAGGASGGVDDNFFLIIGLVVFAFAVGSSFCFALFIGVQKRNPTGEDISEDGAGNETRVNRKNPAV